MPYLQRKVWSNFCDFEFDLTNRRSLIWFWFCSWSLIEKCGFCPFYDATKLMMKPNDDLARYQLKHEPFANPKLVLKRIKAEKCEMQ